MALTATKSPQGFQPLKQWPEGGVILLPGDPGVTFARGDSVCMGAAGAGTAGLLVLAADSSANVIGVVEKTTVCPANSVAFPIPGTTAWVDDGSSTSKTLVPVRLNIAAGTQMFKASFANHYDDTVASYSAASLYIGLTTGMGADNRGGGALVYVYEGPGAGEVNIIDDYDHTGGTVEKMATLARPFNATLTTASKVIIIAGEAASAYTGIGPFGLIDADTVSALDASDGYNDGDWNVVLDWREATAYLKELTLPVVSTAAVYK